MELSMQELEITSWRRTEDLITESETGIKMRNPLFAHTFKAQGQLWFVSSDITRHFLNDLDIDLKWASVKEEMINIHMSTAGRRFTKCVTLKGLLTMIDYESEPRRTQLREFVQNVSAKSELNTSKTKKIKVIMSPREKELLVDGI